MPDTVTPAVPANSWEAASDALLKRDTAQQIRNNLMNNAGKSADQAAEYQHLAAFVQVPVDAVHQDPESVKAQAAAQRIDADTLATTSPKTASYLTNPDNAAKSHDDVHSLTGLEGAIKALPAPQKPAPSFGEQALDFVTENLKSLVSAPGATSTPAEIGKGAAGSFNKAAGAVNLVLGAFPTLYDKAASVLTGKDTTSAGDFWFRNMVDPRMNAQAGFEVPKDAPFVAKAGNTAGNLLGMMAQIVGTGGGGAVAASSSVAGAVGAAAAHGARSMAFPAIADSVTTANNVYQQTGDLNAAMRAAQAQYLTTTMAGVVPLGMPGSAWARAGTGFVSGATVGETGRSAMNMVLPSSMAQPFDVEGLVLSGLAGAGLGAAMGQRAQPNYNDALRQVYADSMRADRATQGAEALAALGEMATSSKTRERDPAAFRQLVQDMTENGQLHDVYISAKDLGEVLNQSGITPEQLAEKLPDVAAQIHEATMTNGDVRIPVEDYATHIAGGPVDAALLPHLKTDAEGMTFKEAQDHFAGQQDSMKATAEQLGKEQEQANTKAADGQGVHDDILAQLDALKRFNPETNKSYAALMRAFFETQGERHGMTAREVYEKSGLNIKGQALDDVLNQPAYHGTPHQFDKFSTDHIGSGEGNQAYGWGLYFAGNKSIAEYYRKTLSTLEDTGGKPAVLDGLSPKARQFVQEQIAFGAEPAAMIREAEQTGMQAEMWDRQDVKAGRTASRADYVAAMKEAATYLADKKRGKGQVYEVDIPEDQHMLYWDKPISTQPEAVQKIRALLMSDAVEQRALDDFGVNTRKELADMVLAKDSTGQDVYGSLTDVFRTDKEASSQLHQAGVAGIKYLNGASRADGEGDHNYVIFHGDAATITGKFYQSARTIEVDGVRRPIENSNGRPLGATFEEQQAFWKWFGDSKAVDAQGKPLAAYHGTGNDFAEFNGRPDERSLLRKALNSFGAGYDSAFFDASYKDRTEGQRALEVGASWFTTSTELANDYAMSSRAENAAPNVMPVYLTLKRPAILDADAKTLTMPDGKVVDWSSFFEDASPHLRNWSIMNSIALHAARTGGGDGAILRGVNDKVSSESGNHPADSFIAFKPEQVKSATGNDGTFDAHDPSILSQGAGNRGAYDPKTATLALLKAADLSTFLHESGHFFLEAMTGMASRPTATDSMRADAQSLLSHLGIDGTPEMGQLDRWAMMDVNEKRIAHEQFAVGFEKYLMEGKAPTIELQGLFSRFRSWLLNVYKNLAGLDVKLAPEVRAIMDRMLASDEAIREAEQTRSYKKLFDNTDDSAAGRALFDKYQTLGARATDEAIADMTGRSVRDLQWSSNAKSKAIKAMQREAAGKRSMIRDQVEKEVAAQPHEQARAFLKSGKLFDAQGNELPDTRPLGAPVVKLDAEALKTMYPKDALGNPDLAKLRGLTAKDGLHPDIVAEMFGLLDGHELVRQLTEARPAKEVVREITDQRMLEQHGELTDAAHIEQAANEAVHNETRARFMATGLKILSKSPIPARQLVKAAREAAEASIAGKRVRDLRPLQYLAAEARSNKEALALAPKDPAGAVQAQRAALLNNQLFRAADAAVRAVQKDLKYLSKFDKDTVRAKIDLEYRDQIDALLDRHDLRKNVSGVALDKREALMSFVERMAAAGFEPQVPERLLNEAKRTHYKDMTVEEFGGLVDAVKSIDHLGRLKTELLDGKEKREIAVLATEAADVMAALPQRGAESNRGLTRIGAAWLGAKSAGRSLQASLLKMEQMMDWLDARNSNGVFNRVVFRRISDAGVKEYELQKQVKAGIDELLHQHLDDVTKEGGKIFTAERLIDSQTGKPQRFTKKEMLALAGNMGNESNLSKLAAGEKWDEQHVWDFLHGNMKKADWDFVAGMGRAMESLWGEKLAMSRRLGNSNPEKIAPRPFDTPHGRYEGWYWPMVYDPARAQDVAERGARSGDALFENIYTRANTDTGRMNTRNENYARPLLLSLDVVPRVLKDEIHDIAYREAIMDADRFLATPKVRDGIVSALSQEHYDQLRPWLQSIANDRKVDMQALKWFDQVAHGARTRATIVGLGYRISTMLVHGSSAAMESIAEVGPVWMAKGMADFTNPLQWKANKDFIFERSGEMKNRMNEVDRDVREHLREIDLRLMDTTTGVIARGADLMKAHAYDGIAMLDMASALPTWMGAYHKGMAPEAQGGKGLGEQDAIYFADKTVRNAHGGNGVKDMAAVQRGPEFMKLFTMFYTFWNHNINRLMDTARLAGQLPETYRSGAPGEFKGDLGKVIMRTLIYTIGVQTMHHMLHPQKDEEGEINWAAWAAKEFTASAFSGIPILRDMSAHYLTGKDYSVTPAAGMVDAVGRTGQDAANAMAGREVSPKWVKHTVTTAGYVFGLPLGQPASAAQFLWDVEQGQVHPESVADWSRGLMHGDMKKH